MGGKEKLEKNVGGGISGLSFGCGESAQGEVWFGPLVPDVGDRIDGWRCH